MGEAYGDGSAAVAGSGVASGVGPSRCASVSKGGGTGLSWNGVDECRISGVSAEGVIPEE